MVSQPARDASSAQPAAAAPVKQTHAMKTANKRKEQDSWKALAGSKDRQPHTHKQSMLLFSTRNSD